MATNVYGIAQFSINGKHFSVNGTFEAKPAYIRREVIMPINTTDPCFQEVPVPATITGSILKPKETLTKDILSLTDTTITLVNGTTGKTFTLTSASQTNDGSYDPYTGVLSFVFVGRKLEEA